MPYNNELNRKISSRLDEIYKKYIQNTPFSYEYSESNTGNSNKKLVDESNINKEKSDLVDKELLGGSLGAVGGFARGTIRDTGEGGKVEGAGKNKAIKKEKQLLLTRTLEGGNVGLFKMAKEKMEEKAEEKAEEIKKRGRPNKMRGGTDLAEPHNMVRKDGTTGYGKLDRQIGGIKPVAQMQASTMSGFGKQKRSDIVKKIMKERGVNLAQASSIVKKENLYKK